MRGRGVTAAVLALGALALAAPGAGTSPPTSFHGTATLRAFDVVKNCKAALTPDRKFVDVSCTSLGAFAGQPGPAGASYGWVWRLALDARGGTSGKGTERGNAILNFGGPGLLYLSLTGNQLPVGRATPTKARGLTKGAWTMTKGTGTFAGKHGKGTYTFETARSGSKTRFSVAKLTFSGNIA